MHESAISNPQHFRNILVDDLQRSNYIHDAEVVHETSDSTASRQGPLWIHENKITKRVLSYIFENHDENNISNNDNSDRMWHWIRNWWMTDT